MNFTLTKKKFFKEWKWALVLLFLCLVGIPVTAGFGFVSDNWGNSFWPNFFSEMLGMFIGLIFGAVFSFVVIDKYIQYHKNLQWKKIKENTYKNLYFILSNILLKMNWSFPKDMRVGFYVLNEDMNTLNEYLPESDFDVFVDSLSKSIDELIKKRHSKISETINPSDSFEDEQLHSSLEKFKQHTKSDMISLNSLIIPRLLNFSDNPVLLDDVIELEELFTSLMSKIKHEHRKNGDGNPNSDVKYIWLLKVEEILKRIRKISDSIQNDITVD